MRLLYKFVYGLYATQVTVKEIGLLFIDESASVANDVGEGLLATLQSCKSGNALMNLFWEEKKAFTTSPKGLQ